MGWDILRTLDLYRAVLSDIGADLEAEWDASLAACLAARSLGLRDPGEVLEDLGRALKGRRALVVGAGPSAEPSQVREILGSFDAVLCADGACRSVDNFRGTAVSVTDLDGGLDPAEKISRLGGYVVIQVHGDNYRHVLFWLERIRGWSPRTLLAVQTRPLCSEVSVIPGFTDGDRALILALTMGVSSAATIGMDFSSTLTNMFYKGGEPVLTYATPKKVRKLGWGLRISRDLIGSLIKDTSEAGPAILDPSGRSAHGRPRSL